MRRAVGGLDRRRRHAGRQHAYYESVVRTTGQGDVERVKTFYRLFMLPSVGHCGANGAGPNNIGGEGQVSVSQDPEHDVLSAVEAWVENDQRRKS